MTSDCRTGPCPSTADPVQPHHRRTGGTTTKINAPGVALDTDQARRLTELVLEHAASAAWWRCGSLPPGLPDNWYRTLLDALADLPCRVAVDTSGPPLVAAAGARSDLLKTNDEELAGSPGADPGSQIGCGSRDLAPIVAAATGLSARTGGSVLLHAGCGGRGAHHRIRQLGGDPATHCHPKHRRRRRLVTGRLRPGRIAR